MFGQKDFSEIEREILKLNKKIKSELYDIPEDHRVRFSGVTSELSDILRKLS